MSKQAYGFRYGARLLFVASYVSPFSTPRHKYSGMREVNRFLTRVSRKGRQATATLFRTLPHASKRGRLFCWSDGGEQLRLRGQGEGWGE